MSSIVGSSARVRPLALPALPALRTQANNDVEADETVPAS